jgi:hypothetical protein
MADIHSEPPLKRDLVQAKPPNRQVNSDAERLETKLSDLPPSPSRWRLPLPAWIRSLIWTDEVSAFHAFLSYSWAADRGIAPVIQSALQGFLRPWFRVRALNIFRDLSCLPANSKLEEALANRLDRSRHLIALAAPEAKDSAGMEFEAAHWFSRSRSGDALVIVTSGCYSNWPEIQDSALPPTLRRELQAAPLWIDLSPHRDRMLARPLGPELKKKLPDFLGQLILVFYPGQTWEWLRGEERAQRRRTLRLLSSFAAVLLALLVVAAWSWNAKERSEMIAEKQQHEAEANAKTAQEQKDKAEASDLEAKQQALLAQSKEAAGYRMEVAQLDLPPDIYGAPALESLAVDTPPMARLDWIRPPLKHLAIAINEGGAPVFPQFLTELAISGQADNTSTRYYVDTSQLPPQLSSLTLEGVHLRNPGRLRSLSGLKELSLTRTYLPGGDLLQLPSRLRSLSISASDLDGIDLLPSSLVSLSIENLGLGNLLVGSNIKELHTDDLGVLDRLPKSTTTLSLVAEKLDSQKLQILRGTATENLEVSLKAKAQGEPAEVFDIDWLPQSISELSLANVEVVHSSGLMRLNRLTKVALNNASLDLTALPRSVREYSLEDCGGQDDDLKSLPSGLNRLALGCAGEFRRIANIIQRFRSLSALTVLQPAGDEVNFNVLPATLKRFATAVAPPYISTLSLVKLGKLQELSLDLTPGTGSSELPSQAARTRDPVEANLYDVDVKDLPRSLTKLRLTNLRLTHAKDLVTLNSLVELTVDHYNRGIVGIPRTLKKLVVKDQVSGGAFSRMVAFR